MKTIIFALLLYVFLAFILPTKAQNFVAPQNYTIPTNISYPYVLGPFTLQQYPYYTLGPNNLTGQVWLRINDAFDHIQFMYRLNQDPTTTPYWPFWAMHLHFGEVKAGNKPGPIVITIRGKGDIIGLSSPDSIPSYAICSSSCLPDALGCDPNCPPDTTSSHVFAYADACPGGCDGDERDGYGNISLAPSRHCDLDNSYSNNPPQNTWMDGRLSDERSGNDTDSSTSSPYYSPTSIFKVGNFQNWCSYSIGYLASLFEPGMYTYVALHSNFNATGAPDILYGTLLAIVNDGSGIDVLGSSSVSPTASPSKSPSKSPSQSSSPCNNGCDGDTNINFNFENMFRRY